MRDRAGEGGEADHRDQVPHRVQGGVHPAQDCRVQLTCLALHLQCSCNLMIMTLMYLDFMNKSLLETLASFPLPCYFSLVLCNKILKMFTILSFGLAACASPRDAIECSPSSV